MNEKLKQKREELAEQIEINAKIEEENRFLIDENEEMESNVNGSNEARRTRKWRSENWNAWKGRARKETEKKKIKSEEMDSTDEEGEVS